MGNCTRPSDSETSEEVRIQRKPSPPDDKQREVGQQLPARDEVYNRDHYWDEQDFFSYWIEFHLKADGTISQFKCEAGSGRSSTISRSQRLMKKGTYTMMVGQDQAVQLSVTWANGTCETLQVGEKALRPGHPPGLSPSALDTYIKQKEVYEQKAAAA